MIFVDFVVLRENFWFLPPKIRSRRHVGAGWFLTTALVGMGVSRILCPGSFSRAAKLTALLFKDSVCHDCVGGVR